MKKLIAVLILTATQSIAQITLTSANNPSPGENNHYTICDTTNISEGTSGANQTWSFPVLTGTDSGTVRFVNPGSTPYASQFPSSNIATTEDEATFSYLTSSSSNLISNGSAGLGLTINYSNPQTYLQFPFSYSSNFTDNFAAHYSSQGFEVFSTGTVTVTADAWGTITLPAGTFSNALRLKFVTVTNDSTSIGISTSNATSYSWFVNGRKLPIFTITYTSFSFNGFPLGSDKSVNYSDHVTIGITNISTETPGEYRLSQNYPNPFNPATTLEFGITKPEFVSLKIYDMLGKETAVLVSAKLRPGTYKYNFNASGLTSGIYFYTLKTENFSETKRMTLVK
ncbi:MAG: T9SS type A sorting domain-containing protein [Ignavibacteria bacterium]|nr:T9SS type A sorting domain-containing protein [Ignavibacteria bacterium]